MKLFFSPDGRLPETQPAHCKEFMFPNYTVISGVDANSINQKRFNFFLMQSGQNIKQAKQDFLNFAGAWIKQKYKDESCEKELKMLEEIRDKYEGRKLYQAGID